MLEGFRNSFELSNYIELNEVRHIISEFGEHIFLMKI